MTQILHADPVVKGRVEVDDVFPLALLRDVDGHRVPVVDGPTVVVFHPGLWHRSSRSALTVHGSEVLPELERRRVRLVAVGPQDPGSRAGLDRFEPGFPALTDEGGQLAHVLGLDVPRGRDGAVPPPTAVVVDADGVVTHVDAPTGPSQHAAASAVLRAVRALG